MGTRSIIRFQEKRGERVTPLVNVFQMWDGYVDGVGYDLAEWLLKKKIVNGISLDDDRRTVANGAGCLAAQYICDHKDGAGDLYIWPIDSEPYGYGYTVTIDEGKVGQSTDDLVTIEVRVEWRDNQLIFKGKPSELLDFKESYDDEL